MGEYKSIQIVNVEDAKTAFAVEVFADNAMMTITVIEKFPWVVGDPVEGLQIDIPFAAVRTLSTALSRAYYLEMPDTRKLIIDDPQLFIAHISELLYDLAPNKQNDPIANLVDIGKQYRRSLRHIGTLRKKLLSMKNRYEHAAEWARKNHKKLEYQRKAIAALEKKLETKNGD